MTWKPFSVSELGLLAALKNHRSGVAAQREARIQIKDKHMYDCPIHEYLGVPLPCMRDRVHVHKHKTMIRIVAKLHTQTTFTLLKPGSQFDARARDATRCDAMRPTYNF